MEKIIDVSFPGGMKIDAKIGETVIKTDQLVRNGGEGSAPEPFQLFLTSIATCVGIYAWGFCKAREIPTDNIALKMICLLDPEKRRYTKMTFNLTLPDNFPEKYRASIIRSMDLCSVKKHMIDEPEFEINAL